MIRGARPRRWARPSAFAAIVVYGQELLPNRIGMVSGLFFGLAFGFAGIGAAGLGYLADRTSIEFVYRVCGFLPLLGLLAAFLPNLDRPPGISGHGTPAITYSIFRTVRASRRSSGMSACWS
jgi:hypothetical protein